MADLPEKTQNLLESTDSQQNTVGFPEGFPTESSPEADKHWENEVAKLESAEGSEPTLEELQAMLNRLKEVPLPKEKIADDLREHAPVATVKRDFITEPQNLQDLLKHAKEAEEKAAAEIIEAAEGDNNVSEGDEGDTLYAMQQEIERLERQLEELGENSKADAMSLDNDDDSASEAEFGKTDSLGIEIDPLEIFNQEGTEEKRKLLRALLDQNPQDVYKKNTPFTVRYKGAAHVVQLTCKIFRRSSKEDSTKSRYEVKSEAEPLGGGNFGKVWKAITLVPANEDNLEKRDTRVIKVQKPQDNEDDQHFKERIAKEDEFNSKIEHLHAKKSLFKKAKDGSLRAVTVMRHLSGKELLSLLKEEKENKRPAMSPSRRLALTRALLQALQDIHAKNILHRDLKPENIFVEGYGTDNPVVKIIDFGLSAEATSNPTDVAGTPLYMAPEVLLGEANTFASDLNSMGWIIAELWGASLDSRIFYMPPSVYGALIQKGFTEEKISEYGGVLAEDYFQFEFEEDSKNALFFMEVLKILKKDNLSLSIAPPGIFANVTFPGGSEFDQKAKSEIFSIVQGLTALDSNQRLDTGKNISARLQALEQEVKAVEVAATEAAEIMASDDNVEWDTWEEPEGSDRENGQYEVFSTEEVAAEPAEIVANDNNEWDAWEEPEERGEEQYEVFPTEEAAAEEPKPETSEQRESSVTIDQNTPGQDEIFTLSEPPSETGLAESEEGKLAGNLPEPTEQEQEQMRIDLGMSDYVEPEPEPVATPTPEVAKKTITTEMLEEMFAELNELPEKISIYKQTMLASFLAVETTNVAETNPNPENEIERSREEPFDTTSIELTGAHSLNNEDSDAVLRQQSEAPAEWEAVEKEFQAILNNNNAPIVAFSDKPIDEIFADLDADVTENSSPENKRVQKSEEDAEAEQAQQALIRMAEAEAAAQARAAANTENTRALLERIEKTQEEIKKERAKPKEKANVAAASPLAPAPPPMPAKAVKPTPAHLRKGNIKVNPEQLANLVKKRPDLAVAAEIMGNVFGEMDEEKIATEQEKFEKRRVAEAKTKAAADREEAIKKAERKNNSEAPNEDVAEVVAEVEESKPNDVREKIQLQHTKEQAPVQDNQEAKKQSDANRALRNECQEVAEYIIEELKEPFKNSEGSTLPDEVKEKIQFIIDLEFKSQSSLDPKQDIKQMVEWLEEKRQSDKDRELRNQLRNECREIATFIINELEKPAESKLPDGKINPEVQKTIEFIADLEKNSQFFSETIDPVDLMVVFLIERKEALTPKEDASTQQLKAKKSRWLPSFFFTQEKPKLAPLPHLATIYKNVLEKKLNISQIMQNHFRGKFQKNLADYKCRFIQPANEEGSKTSSPAA